MPTARAAIGHAVVSDRAAPAAIDDDGRCTVQSSIADNCSATDPALLSTAIPDAVLPHPSMDAYLLHPCSRPALSAYRPSMASPTTARQLLLRCSRRLFPTPFYRIHPSLRPSVVRAVRLRCRHTGHPWHRRQLLGNCSCVALDGCSRRRSTASIHGCVPPASVQSSCVVGIQAIHGIADNCSATAPALLSTAVPDAVLPHPSMDAYLLHPCSRPALPAYRPSMALPTTAPALPAYRPAMAIKLLVSG